jgi:magnesium transporter
MEKMDMLREHLDRLQITPPNTFDTIQSDLILGRSLSKSPGDQLVRCTVFDRKGNVRVVSGEFSRSELLSKHGLLPRDLRKLDVATTSIVPAILVRENSILVNLLHIRALVKADMVLIFDAYGSTDSRTQSVFMYDLEHKLRFGSTIMGNLSYEMRALEAIFISVVNALDAEMQVHVTVVNGILAELEDDIDREKLRHLLIQSKKLSSFLQKATLIRDAINELLDSDDDLAGLYLTEKLRGNPVLPDGDHSEVEMLLEAYYKHCDEIVQTVGNLVSNIRSTEEIINIILDSNRNSLMLLDLKFQIGTLGLGGGAFIASLYGMNLKNFIEETDYGFFAVSGVVCISSAIIILMSLKHLRRVQRITMMTDKRRERKKQPYGSKSSLWSWISKR